MVEKNKIEEKMTEATKIKPDHFRDGALSVTRWHNVSKQGFPYETFNFQRSYKDEEGNWKNTETFRRNDLLRIAELCRHVYSLAPIGASDSDDGK